MTYVLKLQNSTRYSQSPKHDLYPYKGFKPQDKMYAAILTEFCVCMTLLFENMCCVMLAMFKKRKS